MQIEGFKSPHGVTMTCWIQEPDRHFTLKMLSIKRSLAALGALALLAVSSTVQIVQANDASDKGYELLSMIHEDGSPVSVVRRNGALFLVYDKTIIGAEFDDPYLRKQAAYPGFAIMQCVRYIDRPIERAIQVGLGIGTVPSFLRDHGVVTDVVEISSAVVRQAANYFQYEHCEEDDPEECERGTTYITDGLAFIDKAPQEPIYDSFIIDVYTGWNPVAFFVKEVIDTVHTKWLKPRGVLVLNFVGFMIGEHAAVPKSIYRTLLSSFAHVKCYREIPDPTDTNGINIVYFASDEPFTFTVPQDGEYYDPPANTYFHIVRNFQNWEIFTELRDEANAGDDIESVEVEIVQPQDAEEVGFTTTTTAKTATGPRPQVLTKEDHGAEIFRETHEYTQSHMRDRVIEQFPTAFWEELGIDVSESVAASDDAK